MAPLSEFTDGATSMTLQSLVRAGLVAAALTVTTTVSGLTTPALAYQPASHQTDTQNCCPPRNTKNIKVTFKAAQSNPTAQGTGENVAFEIQNIGSLDVAYGGIKLVAS